MEMKKYKIYIAGKLNAMACEYIQNIHKMILMAEEVRLAGFAVYTPAIDFLAGVVCGKHKYNDYFDNSQPFLECCDAVFLVPGWLKSEGTKKEIKKARKLCIPIFEDLDAMKRYFGVE
jgi:hypothetical protein